MEEDSCRRVSKDSHGTNLSKQRKALAVPESLGNSLVLYEFLEAQHVEA